MKKIIAIILSVVLLTSCFLLSAVGATAKTVENDLENPNNYEISGAEVGASSKTSVESGSWKYAKIGSSTIQILSYGGSEKTVEIPSSIDKFKVVKIARGAFFNNKKVVSMSIPATVTEIGWWAFYGCSSLNTVKISEGLAKIGFGAFINCNSLKSVTIPLSINEIGADAFASSCTTKTNVTDGYTGQKISEQSYKRNKAFVVNGYKGTFAEKYASQEGVTFKSRGTVKFGDVNADGRINSADTALLKQCISGKKALGAIQKRNADVDYNGKINQSDYNLIDSCIKNNYSARSFAAAKSINATDNYLYGKSVYCDGDSISKGTGTNILGSQYYSYCNYIADSNKMKLTQKSMPGTTLAQQNGKTGNFKSIMERVLEMKGKYNFILLEGGFNDLFQRIEIGAVTPSSNKSGKYNRFTTAGAVETICWFLKKNYANTPVLFVLPHEKYNNTLQKNYWSAIKTALNKWGIAYIDFSACTQLGGINSTICNQYFRFAETENKGDAIHPLKYVHQTVYAPLIQEKLNSIVSSKTKVSTNKNKISMGSGEKYTLLAKSTYDCKNLYSTWSSSNTSSAAVNSSGTVTANKSGSAVIKMCAGNSKTAECRVNVWPMAKSVSVNKKQLTIGTGETYGLISSVPSGSAAWYRGYSSSNTSVATVSSNGIVTGKKRGTATITCRLSNGAKTTCSVTVKAAPNKMTFNHLSGSIYVGRQIDLDSYVNSGAASYHRYYTSSNTSIATVNSCGIVVGKKRGTVTITCKTYNGIKALCHITVK